MKKILFFLSILSVLFLSACGIKSVKVTDDGVDLKTDNGGSVNVTDDGVKAGIEGEGNINVGNDGVEIKKGDKDLDEEEKESLKVINEILND